LFDRNKVLVPLLGSFLLSAVAVRGSPVPVKITAPRFLGPRDARPLKGLNSPGSSVLGPDGKNMDVREGIHAPGNDRMASFAGPELYEAMRGLKSSEKGIQRFQWHRGPGRLYCHYRDVEGNHWFGWAEGRVFHWILWRGRRLWWKDPLANHWLYYDRGYWWRPGGQKKGTIQVCLDGEYYLCAKDGTLLGDEGGDGNGAIVSPAGRYQGDRRGGARGSRGPRAGGPRGGAESGKAGVQGN
jgi:hypothetical protein